jgi:protein TonB
MFEDSLVESSGRIRTRSKWYAIGSFLIEAVALAALILIPFIYPAALPPQALTRMLIAPPPPLAPAPASHTAPAQAQTPVPMARLVNLAAPKVIPTRIVKGDNAPAPPMMNPGVNGTPGGDVISRLGIALPAAPAPPHAKAEGPFRVSSGVAEGRLLAPIQPIYPAIAKAARIQGTVVIEAVISKQGLVTQAQVVSGQPMLARAALQAVRRARYQPYQLNGQPVEVYTTININFVLGN